MRKKKKSEWLSIVKYIVYFVTKSYTALRRLVDERLVQVFGPLKEFCSLFGPRQANLVLIAYASSEGSGEPAHPRSLARTSAARSYKQ